LTLSSSGCFGMLLQQVRQVVVMICIVFKGKLQRKGWSGVKSWSESGRGKAGKVSVRWGEEKTLHACFTLASLLSRHTLTYNLLTTEPTEQNKRSCECSGCNQNKGLKKWKIIGLQIIHTSYTDTVLIQRLVLYVCVYTVFEFWVWFEYSQARVNRTLNKSLNKLEHKRKNRARSRRGLLVLRIRTLIALSWRSFIFTFRQLCIFN
jgi:hypothetical protein